MRITGSPARLQPRAGASMKATVFFVGEIAGASTLRFETSTMAAPVAISTKCRRSFEGWSKADVVHIGTQRSVACHC